MIQDFMDLYEKFKKIKSMGWIESMRRGTTGIGYTFERLLGKEEEQFPIPDYGCIEIKTKFRNSKYPIGLFCATPDGDYLFPMKRLYERFGWPQSKYKDVNGRVFYAEMNAVCYTHAGMNYQFKLYVDRINRLIKVYAYSKKTGVIDPEISWSFDFLRDKIERKLKYLALVRADAHNEVEKQFFYYDSITFYILRDFETFISLIENGTIKVIFNVGCYSSGPKKGKMDNRGATFNIAQEDLENLFFKIG